MNEAQRQPNEQYAQPQPYGVETMSPGDLSRLIAELEAANEESLRTGNDHNYDTKSFDALTAEVATVLKTNPEKGRELCVAMVTSRWPQDRYFIAPNMVDLMDADRGRPGFWDEEQAPWWFANLLADENEDVSRCASICFSNGINRGRLSIHDVAAVAENLAGLVKATREGELDDADQ